MVIRHTNDTFTINSLGVTVDIATLEKTIRELDGYWPETHAETEQKRKRKNREKEIASWFKRHRANLSREIRQFESDEKARKQGTLTAPATKAQEKKYTSAKRELDRLDNLNFNPFKSADIDRKNRWIAKLEKLYGNV